MGERWEDGGRERGESGGRWERRGMRDVRVRDMRGDVEDGDERWDEGLGLR